MFKFPRSSTRRNRPNRWRDSRSDRHSSTSIQRPRRRFLLRGILLGTLSLIVLSGLIDFLSHHRATPSTSSPTTATATLSKEQLRHLLDVRDFNNLTSQELELPAAGQRLQVTTTVDPDLQSFLLNTIDRTYSRYVGIVVMEADTGRILALAGFDRTDPGANPCLHSQFPAASVFKIVTAATAVDQLGYSADSPVSFNGAKHTLYKRQLTDSVNRYTTTLPLREAFAESVNPVFGKLGELRLGKPRLERAAASFGFNRSLDFELPISPSRFHISDEPYNWAEVASGFNQETTLSPLHGAALAAAVINDGHMVTPTIVEQVADAEGQIIYRRPVTRPATAIMSPRAAAALEEMMETTVASGTARKAFRRYRQDAVLSRLELGGKTGSIDNPTHDVRYDWFVGFAKERYGEDHLVVSVLVGHEKFIGTRASDYARQAISYYFSNTAKPELRSQLGAIPAPQPAATAQHPI